MIVAAVAFMVLGYCYLDSLPAYYVFPFTLALVILEHMEPPSVDV